MKGFGIEFKDLKHYGDETDPRICDHEIRQGDQEKGRTAMENELQTCTDGTHGDGERAAEVPGREPRLYDQRAGRGGRVGSAEGRRQGRWQRADCVDRRRLPRREERQFFFFKQKTAYEMPK